MRVFWSVVLAGGLFLVGLDAYESRRGDRDADRQPTAMCEDGTPMPNSPPPPPPR